MKQKFVLLSLSSTAKMSQTSDSMSGLLNASLAHARLTKSTRSSLKMAKGYGVTLNHGARTALFPRKETRLKFSPAGTCFLT